jgi:hypothetical protein
MVSSYGGGPDSEYMARRGGDEYIVLIGGLSPMVAAKRLDESQQALGVHGFHVPNSDEKYTATVTGAYGTDVRTLQGAWSLINSADRRQGEYKQGPRDVWPALLIDSHLPR